MLDFAHPYLLFILFALPAVGAMYWLSRRSMRQKLKRFGRLSVISQLMPDVSRYKPAIKLTLRLIALAALVFILARPRHGEKEEVASRAGAEIVIAFDVSRSMLASSSDDPNGISRLNRARMLLEKLVNGLKNNKIGLVVFAGNAATQLPLTSDANLVQLTLRNDLTPGMMSNQGTSISDAIQMSALTFPGLRDRLTGEGDESRKEVDGIHRAIILITDAEDHEGDAVQTAAYVNELGVQIDVIGVGTGRGGKIPMGNGEFLRDEDGSEVVTSFNEEAAKAIAEAGNGVYVNAAAPDALTVLRNSIDKLQKTEIEKVTYKMSAEQFPLFAWIALAFILIDFIVLERKNELLKGVNFFTNSFRRKK